MMHTHSEQLRHTNYSTLENALVMGRASQEKGINTSTTRPQRQFTHIITARMPALISHTQLVHLVNVKRAVIVNYIPI